MAPPTRRRRPATSFFLVLLAQRATTFAPRPRLAAPRHRHTQLASSSKPLPDSNIPGLTRDKDDLPGDEQPEEDAADAPPRRRLVAGGHAGASGGTAG